MANKDYENNRAYKIAGDFTNAIGGLAALTLLTIGAQNLANITDPNVINTCMESYHNLSFPTWGFLTIGSLVTSFSIWGIYQRIKE